MFGVSDAGPSVSDITEVVFCVCPVSCGRIACCRLYSPLRTFTTDVLSSLSCATCWTRSVCGLSGSVSSSRQSNLFRLRRSPVWSSSAIAFDLVSSEIGVVAPFGVKPVTSHV